MTTNTCLAALVTPWLFYAGCGAMGVPILIHLLARRRFRRIRWAAVEFLVLAEKRKRRKINIQELILLVLRCLAVALLGLLLARPFLKPTGLAGVLASHSRWQRVLVLDDSFSMGYTSGSASTFDQAKADLLTLLRWFRSGSPADEITLVITSAPDDPLLEDLPAGEVDVEGLRRRIEALHTSHQPAKFGELLPALAKRLAGDESGINTAVYVVSDFQKKDWLVGSGEGGSTAPSPLDGFAEWPDQRGELKVHLIQADREQQRSNLAVTGLSALQPQVVATIENRFRAKVVNFSAAPSQPLDLDVYLDDAAQPSVPVPAIPPGESVDVALSVTFPRDGAQSVRVEVPSDALSLDNQRLTAHDVQSGIRVLIFNGEPGSRAVEDEVALLRTALRPEGEAYSGFQISVAGEGQIDQAALDGFHLVILANVYRITDDAATRLEDFVRRGGGLIVFLGDQVDADLYNERLWRRGEGLLPCRLGAVVSTASGQTPPSLVGTDLTHPLAGLLAGDHNVLVRGLAFWQYVECMLSSDEPSSARVIAEFLDEQRRPAIVTRLFGRGRVMLVATTADVEWNNWAKWPSYLVFVQELGQWAARPGRMPGDTFAGARAVVALRRGAYQSSAVVRTPSYPAEPERPIPVAPAADPAADDRADFKTDKLGIYHLLLTSAAGLAEQLMLAVNLDPAESDLDGATEPEIRRAAPGVEFEYLSEVAGLADRPDEGQREFWRTLLVAALCVLMVEQTLACWFGRSS